MEEVRVVYTKDEFYSLLDDGVVDNGTPVALIEPDFEHFRMQVDGCSLTDVLTKFDEKFLKVSDNVHYWIERVLKVIDICECQEDDISLNLGFLLVNVKHGGAKYSVSLSVFE